MTLSDLIALFGTMLILAALPSVSVLAVTARATSYGFAHGAATTLGIVLADLLFILLAIFGLSILTTALGEYVFLLHYLAGVYLLWLGSRLWRQAPNTDSSRASAGHSPAASFRLGLLITLADQKAVLFYLAFLPAFVDLEQISGPDIALVCGITILAVGGSKLVYAWLAARAGARFGIAKAGVIQRLAALLMIAAGIWLMFKGLL